MLITFKSKAAPDIIMYKEHARNILELLDKDIDRGIITHADTSMAIATIEAAIGESRVHPISQSVQFDITNRALQTEHGDTEHEHEHERVESVSFASRAFPLLEMLRAAHTGGSDVVWGV
jgi:hypothetical protein